MNTTRMPNSMSFLWYLALVLDLVFLSLLLALPYALQWQAWENPLESLAVVFVIGLGLTSLFAARYKRSRANTYRAVTAVILAVPVCFVASNRAFEVERLSWEVHGNVEDKYKSSNHGALALRIAGARYEYIDAAFWNMANVGDRVDKEKYSIYGKLNEQRRIFVLPNLVASFRGRLIQE